MRRLRALVPGERARVSMATPNLGCGARSQRAGRAGIADTSGSGTHARRAEARTYRAGTNREGANARTVAGA